MLRVLPVLFACLATACFTGADWLQFRGNDANGVAASPVDPALVDKVAWKAPLPGRGLSGPTVVGNQVVLSCSSGFNDDRLHVLSFDADTGEQQWSRQFWATGRTQCHKKMCVATPQVASDGERLFAFYSSNDLICLDLAGNLLWYRGLGLDFPNASNSLGMSSSPVLSGDTVIVQVESDAEAFSMGLDVATGVTRWKIDRPRGSNWTSPAILRKAEKGRDLVLLQSGKGLAAVRPDTGETVWEYEEGASRIPSSLAEGGLIFLPAGGLTALRPVPGGSTPELLWQDNRFSPSTASPVAIGGRVYVSNRAGVVSAVNATTGNLDWRVRLTGPFTATPIAAGDYLYFVSEKGMLQVVEAGKEKGSIAVEFDLQETILGTPAVVDGALYVRSDAHLWKLGGSK